MRLVDDDKAHSEGGQQSGGVESAVQPKKISREVTVFPVEVSVLSRAKKAFATRRVPLKAFKTLINGPVRPRTGDLVLARIDRINYQRRLELENGRKANFQVGDTIIVAYGDRYATDQYEAVVALDLGPTNLVATGGVAGRMVSRRSGMRRATDITPLGLLGDAAGKPINLIQYAIAPVSSRERRPKIIAVLGTSMNSGKTTTNHAMVTGLRRAGFHPAAIKMTGTGSGGDYWSLVDAGAHQVTDFTDAGYSSTYKLSIDKLEAIMIGLVSHAAASGADVILVEVADGIFQEQNIHLIGSPVFQDLVDAVFFAAGEALGAAMGVSRLRSLGFPVIGVSGALTGSELLIREAEYACDAKVYRKEDLANPHKIGGILSLKDPSLSEGRATTDNSDESREMPVFFTASAAEDLAADLQVKST